MSHILHKFSFSNILLSPFHSTHHILYSWARSNNLKIRNCFFLWKESAFMYVVIRYLIIHDRIKSFQIKNLQLLKYTSLTHNGLSFSRKKNKWSILILQCKNGYIKSGIHKILNRGYIFLKPFSFSTAKWKDKELQSTSWYMHWLPSQQ